MASSSNQFQAPDEEEDENCNNEITEIQETGFNGKSIDAHLLKWRAFVASEALSSAQKRIHSERLMQECFNSAYSPRITKPKRRKAENVVEAHGGRVVRSTGRKDRHSKVCTARGPRDRRVRLSPKTAIQFYDVQDRLGYDRPSKAIDWLMKEAKSAIDALEEPLILPFSENHSRSQEISDGNPVSSFSFYSNGDGFSDANAPSSSAQFQVYSNQDLNPSRNRNEGIEDSTLHYQDGFFLSGLTGNSPQIFDINSEISRQQRIFSWNSSNLNSGDGREGGTEYSDQFNSLPLANQIFLQREPLQSSIIINNSPISNQFPGINFSGEEFSDFATMEDDGKDQNVISRKLPSTAPFLNHED